MGNIVTYKQSDETFNELRVFANSLCEIADIALGQTGVATSLYSKGATARAESPDGFRCAGFHSVARIRASSASRNRGQEG